MHGLQILNAILFLRVVYQNKYLSYVSQFITFLKLSHSSSPPYTKSYVFPLLGCSFILTYCKYIYVLKNQQSYHIWFILYFYHTYTTQIQQACIEMTTKYCHHYYNHNCTYTNSSDTYKTSTSGNVKSVSDLSTGHKSAVSYISVPIRAKQNTANLLQSPLFLK